MNSKIQDIRKELNAHFRGNSEIIDIFLASVLSKMNVLIMSSHGRGKSHLAETTATLMNTSYARVQGSQGLTESKFLAKYNVGKLLKGEEDVQWRDFVTANIKFVDEINRCHPTVLNSMFSLMAEHIAIFGDQRINVPKFALIATMNPTDDGTYQMPAPMVDRFDICMTLPSLRFQDKIKVIDLQEKVVNKILKDGELESLWEEVSQVKIPHVMQIKATTMVRDLQLCCHGEKELLTNFPVCCGSCRFNGNVCSRLDNKSPVSERAYLSAIKLMKGLSFVKGKPPTNDDLKTAMRYVLAHRMRLLPIFEKKQNSKTEATTVIIQDLFKQDYQRKSAYEIVAKIGQGKAELKELDDFATNDMFIKELQESLADRVKQMEETLNLDGMSPEKIQRLIKDIESGKVEVENKKLAVESLMTKLSKYLNRSVKISEDAWPVFIGLLEANNIALGKNLRLNLGKDDISFADNDIEFFATKIRGNTYDCQIKGTNLQTVRKILSLSRKASGGRNDETD